MYVIVVKQLVEHTSLTQDILLPYLFLEHLTSHTHVHLAHFVCGSDLMLSQMPLKFLSENRAVHSDLKLCPGLAH